MINCSSSPLGLLAFYALFFLNPTKTFKYKERQWMMGVFLRSIMMVTMMVVLRMIEVNQLQNDKTTKSIDVYQL